MKRWVLDERLLPDGGLKRVYRALPHGVNEEGCEIPNYKTLSLEGTGMQERCAPSYSDRVLPSPGKMKVQ